MILVSDVFGGLLPPVLMDFIVPACFVGGIAMFLIYKFAQKFGLINW